MYEYAYPGRRYSVTRRFQLAFLDILTSRWLRLSTSHTV